MLVLLFLNDCTNKNNSFEKPVISVSILPQKYFVEKITGDKFRINVLIPPGASEENYDPTPRQIADLLNSVLYFRIGYIEFEKTWITNFLKDHPELKVSDMSKNIPVFEEGIDGNDNEWKDPHIWMSPGYVKIIADNIYKAIVSIDSGNKTFYHENLLKFSTEIDSVESVIRSKLKGAVTKSFIIYHPALTYYSADFGLHQIPLEFEGKSPSANYIRRIIDTAKREKIQVILVQKQFDMSKAEIIAKEIHGHVIQIDPLDYNWKNQILAITEKLANALRDQKP